MAKYSKSGLGRRQRSSASSAAAKRDKDLFQLAAQRSDQYQEEWTIGRAVQVKADQFESSNRFPMSIECPAEKVLDRFEGYVAHVQDGTAFVRLRTQAGEELDGEYAASELEARGIFEHRRFTLETLKVGESLEVRFSSVADVEIPPDVDQEISERISNLVANGNLDADD